MVFTLRQLLGPGSLTPLISLALMALTAIGHADSNEIFVGHSNGDILKGPADGIPVLWTNCSVLPLALLTEGENLIVGAAGGRILRLDRSTGEILSEIDTGLGLRDLALHDGRFLVASSDNLIHLIHAHSGQQLAVLHPSFPPMALVVHGDRVYSGSSNGKIEYSDVNGDQWSLLQDGIPGGVTDMAFGGESLHYTSSQSMFVFKKNVNLALPPETFPVTEPPTTLSITGTSIFVGTAWAGIYDYDVPTWATLAFYYVGFPAESIFINHTQGVGTPYCAGDDCPCANSSGNGGCANSTGSGARLVGSGNSDLSFGDLNLSASGLPANVFGLFFMGQATDQLSFGDGRLCVGGGGQGIYRFPVRSSGPGGLLQEHGLAAHSFDHFAANGLINAGSTWNFQAWYRDNQGPCGSGFNTSNAWTVSFTE